MTDRATLFNNEHDRPIALTALRGSLFGHDDVLPDHVDTVYYGQAMADLSGTNDHHEMARMADEGNPHHDTDLNDPARLYYPLTAEEIDELATRDLPEGDVYVTIAGEDRHLDTISPDDWKKVAQRTAEIQAIAEANKEAAQVSVTEDSRRLPGGIIEPEGYALAGKVSYDDETARIDLTGLRPICSVDNIPGVSATLTRPEYGSPFGYVTLRVIHDAGGVAYLFRKDEGENTNFKVAFGHGAAA